MNIPFKRISQTTAGASILLGATVLTGWTLDAAVLKSLHPAWRDIL